MRAKGDAEVLPEEWTEGWVSGFCSESPKRSRKEGRSLHPLFPFVARRNLPERAALVLPIKAREVWNCLCFEVAAFCSGKQAVDQGLCRSCKPTELSSCFSGNLYHTESQSGSCCPEDCVHAKHSFYSSLRPQMQAQPGIMLKQNYYLIMENSAQV